FDVRIIHFMTYFGEMENSKRVLISASKRKEHSLPLRSIKNANYVGISLMRGSNHIELLTTPKGPKVLKKIPNSSALAQIPEKILNDLCFYLAKSKGPIVSPEKIGDDFRVKEIDGNTYMLFPFVGSLN